MEEQKKGYLILSRRTHQSIMINDEIEILVIGINNRDIGQVRLGVMAPPNIEVHRKEIWEKIQRQKNAGAHNCIDYAEYRIGKSGMRIASCDMCGRRWGIPDDSLIDYC